MATESKRTLRMNVRRLLDTPATPLRPNETGVTRLVQIGIANGTAQRVLDETTDVRLETVDQIASALKVRPWALLDPTMAASKAMPFRDLNGFEAQLVELFRKLTPEQQHEQLIEFNDRVNRLAHPDSPASPADPFKNRREVVLGRIPERRTPDRQWVESPLTHQPRRDDPEEGAA